MIEIKVFNHLNALILNGFKFDSGEILVGRSSKCHIEIPTKYNSVSNIHTRIRINHNLVEIFDGTNDKPSTNGVFLNNQKISAKQWTVLSSSNPNTIILGRPNSSGSVKLLLEPEKLSNSVFNQPTVGMAQSSSQYSQPVRVVKTSNNRGTSYFLLFLKRLLFWLIIGLLLGAIIATILFGPYGFFPGILTGMCIGLFIFFYIIPYYIADIRNHSRKFGILAVNLFLGWTTIGWAAALAWALFTDPNLSITIK